VSVGDEPGDGSFDHGPVLAVVVQVLSVAPVGTGGGENLVVFTDPVGFAVDCGGASDPQRAAPTLGTERGCSGGGDRYRDLVGAGDGSGVVVDGEVVSGELIVAETMVATQRPGFDDCGVFGIFEVGTHRARSVGRIAEDLEARFFVF
jgi:hypothetical protein